MREKGPEVESESRIFICAFLVSTDSNSFLPVRKACHSFLHQRVSFLSLDSQIARQDGWMDR